MYGGGHVRDALLEEKDDLFETTDCGLFSFLILFFQPLYTGLIVQKGYSRVLCKSKSF